MSKNILKLHEAIAVVLLNRPERSGSFNEISSEIEKRNLYINRKGNISLAKQVELRSAIKSSKISKFLV